MAVADSFLWNKIDLMTIIIIIIINDDDDWSIYVNLIAGCFWFYESFLLDLLDRI